MNAKEAAERSKANELRREKADAVRRQKEHEAEEADIKASLPHVLTEARRQIAKAVRDGDGSTTISAGKTAWRLARTLEKDGYQTRVFEDTCNMGDSAAPCMETYRYIEVRWRREERRPY